MMRIKLAMLIVVCMTIFQTNPTQAQTRPIAPDEYIQSTSPLRTGGSISGRTVPGTSRQQIITIAQLPVRNRDNSNSLNGSQFRLVSNSNLGTNRTLQQQVSAQRPAQYDVYPYPATSPPRMARLTPSESVAVAAQTNPVNRTFRRTAFQAPNSNNSVLRTAQNCDCGPTGGFQVPAGTVPNFQSVQVAPQAAPQGPLFVPGTNLSGQPIAPPTYRFQPVIRSQNLPPGTYLGKGIVGQPTAYVPNQPVRNVLRYVFP